MKFYIVGGAVRDEIMGINSHDIDFTAVMEQADIDAYSAHAVFSPFEYMDLYLSGLGYKIFLRTPEFLTIRAQFPEGAGHFGENNGKRLTADFVLARKESGYSDGRHPDHVEPGTLHDDLARRDFTMNAIAKDDEGNFIDPFNGQADISDKVIRCVGAPRERFREDALRAVRALRFSVTKGFTIAPDVQAAMNTVSVLDGVAAVPDDRITAEVSKMLNHDTMASIVAFNAFPALTAAMFSGTVRLDSTMKKAKRN